MLQVLRGAALSDVLAVVIRWYGGTKLGKGGLARAYAGAVKGGLGALPVVERRATTRVRVLLPLSRVGDLKRLVHPPEVEIVGESYSAAAEFVLEVDRTRVAWLAEELAGFSTEVVVAGT